VFTPKELVILLALLVALAVMAFFFTGCSTAPKTPVPTHGAQTLISRATPLAVGPPPPPATMNWRVEFYPGTSNSMYLHKLNGAVQLTTDNVHWMTVSNFVWDGMWHTNWFTNLSQTGYFRLQFQ
jgi:hypothetical protein